MGVIYTFAVLGVSYVVYSLGKSIFYFASYKSLTAVSFDYKDVIIHKPKKKHELLFKATSYITVFCMYVFSILFIPGYIADYFQNKYHNAMNDMRNYLMTRMKLAAEASSEDRHNLLHVPFDADNSQSYITKSSITDWINKVCSEFRISSSYKSYLLSSIEHTSFDPEESEDNHD